MTHIVIRRCSLEIVRCSGAGGLWTGQAENRALAQRIVPQVLRLLEDVLLRTLAGDEDRYVQRPLRLTVPLQLDAAGGRLRPAGWSSVAAIEASLVQALRETGSAESPLEPALAAVTKAAEPSLERASADVAVETLLRLLVAWVRDGTLATRLRLFSESALECWDAALCRACADPVPAEPDLGSDRVEAADVAVVLDQAAGDTGIPVPLAGVERTALLRWRLMALARLAGQQPSASLPLLLRAIDSRLPVAVARSRASAVDASARGEPQGGDGQDHATLQRAGVGPAVSRRRAADSVCDSVAAPAGEHAPVRQLIGTAEVESCLPFLLLGPLHRTGILEILAAVLAEPDLRRYLPHVACALAYKVLDPPERGWRRSPSARNAAAVFVGVSAPPREDEIVDLARSGEGKLSPLSAAVAAVLLAGKDRRTPFLLVRTGRRLALFDADGLFPVLVGDSWADVARGLDQSASFVFVSGEIASGDLLVEIDAASIGFLITGRAARGERWTQSADGGWCTNRPSLVRRRLPSASDLEALAAQAVAVAEALLATPTSVPLAEGGELEQTAGLAAALALGHIAWRMAEKDPEAWRSPDPLLALERFKTLSARVCFSPERVEVVLPLGRRHRDLRDIGLLDSIPGVPWLGDRPVEFRGG